jgi:acyl-CoA reductase-like NAD-dependent aldehyde dehydrogenase
VAERSELVRRVGQLHAEHKHRLGQIIVREMGKPIVNQKLIRIGA